MNVEEKVATLEALLARVQNNAAKPRIPRPAGAAPPNGGAGLAAPEAAVVAPKAPAAKPSEKIAPARVEAAPAQDSIDAQLEKLLDGKAEKPVEAKIEKPVEAKIEKPVEAKIEKPVEAKIEKPVEAKIEKPVEAKVDLLDAWAEALQDEVPKVAAKVDEGTPKPAPIAARSVTPVATKPVAVRPVTPAARPVAPRPTFGAKADATPSPTPAAAKVPEAKVVEKIEPPKPVENVAPIVAAAKPAEKITPAVAAAKPVEKIAAAMPAEKADGIKAAEDEIRFDFDLAPPKKPVEAAVAATPVKAPPLPVEPPPRPVAEKVDLAAEEEDDLVTHDDETMLMHGSIPEPEAPVIADETTSDEETVVALPKAEAIAAKADEDPADDEPTTDASSPGEVDEPTHVFQGRPSRPEADSPAPSKVEAESGAAPKIDDLKVVVSPSVRAPIVHDTSPTDETVRAIKITEAVPAPRPADSSEATAPSRRYSKPAEEEVEPLPIQGGKRASTLLLGLAAAALIGAGVFLGLRNGWFEGSTTQGVPTTPTASGPAPTASTAAIPTASAQGAPATSAATPEPTASAAPPASASAAPPASASAVPTASAAPSATASSAPTAAPATDGDGTNLPPNRGYVIINSSKPASVFLTGNFAGVTGNKLEVECGAKFLRLAAPFPGGERPATPDWTSDGRSITVACRSITTIAFEASR